MNIQVEAKITSAIFLTSFRAQMGFYVHIFVHLIHVNTQHIPAGLVLNAWTDNINMHDRFWMCFFIIMCTWHVLISA